MFTIQIIGNNLVITDQASAVAFEAPAKSTQLQTNGVNMIVSSKEATADDRTVFPIAETQDKNSL